MIRHTVDVQIGASETEVKADLFIDRSYGVFNIEFDHNGNSYDIEIHIDDMLRLIKD